MTADGEERRVAAGALIGETALIVEVVRGAGARATVFDAAADLARTFRRVLGEFPDAAVKVHASVSVRTRRFLDQLEAMRARAFET